LTNLRDTTREILTATKRTLCALNVDGYIARTEVSFEDWSDVYHPHSHAIIHTAPSGKRYVPAHAWEDEWLNALPSHLHPVEGGAHCEPVRDIEATCSYLTKSPFLVHISNQGQIDRTITVIQTTKGLAKLATQGTLTTQRTINPTERKAA
jgi:hypothetical protein